MVSSGRHRVDARGEKRFLAIEDGAGVYRVAAGGALRPQETRGGGARVGGRGRWGRGFPTREQRGFVHKRSNGC